MLMVGEVATGRLTGRDELGIWAFGAYAVALPFIIDQMSSGVLFFLVWLGPSLAAGVLVPRRMILLAPCIAFFVLMVSLMLGVPESEFLSDSLSIVGIWVLMLGEIGLLLVGIEIGRRRGRRRV